MTVLARLSLLCALGLFACGGSGTGGGGGASGDGGPGGGGGGGGDGSCTSAAQCSGDQVCDPATDTCTDSLPCSEHGECGAGGHCAEGGMCAPSTTGSPCDDSTNCSSGEECVNGFCGCEGAAFQAEPVTPNVMIVLDRSGSMEENLNGGDVGANDPSSKWQIARGALDQILAGYGSQVRFGLVLYANSQNPGGDFCNPGQVDVEIGDNTESAIQATIAATSPDTNTPIGDTLEQLIGYSGLADTTRPNYVLLLTDGQENCGGDSADAARALRMQSPSVKTFVVGFGGAVDEDALNDTAEEGGTALPGNTKYYQADDAAALAAAFDSIIGTVLGCSFTLSEVPDDPNLLFIYADGTPVDRDTNHADGWDYDPGSNTVTFYGPACDALQSGSVTDLVIVYGCPGVPVD